MDAVIYKKLILMLLSSNFLYINNATLWNFQLEFSCAKFYKKGELNVDCSYKNLKYIPDLPPNTVYLNLGHNLITQILNSTFEHLTNLKVLDLSFNRLKSVNDQTFNGLGNLKHLKLDHNELTGGMLNKSFEYMTCLTELDLSFNTLQRINEQTFIGLQNLRILQLHNNKLGYDISRFPTGSFKPLESLTGLSIQNNNYMENPDGLDFPDKTISDLTMLEILVLDVNSGLFHKKMDFGKGFSSLKNLYLLNACNCYTFNLKNDTFKYTPNLTHVYLNHCMFDIYTKKHDEFSKLTKLKVLNVTGHPPGRWIYEDQLLFLISSLSNTTIEILKMDHLLNSISGNCLSVIVNKMSVLLSKTSIKELHFTNNFLVQVHQRDLPVHAPPSLRTLNLGDNRFEVLRLNIKQVTSLNLEDNRLGNYLANNSLWRQESNLEYISLSNNSIYKLHTTIFKGQKYLRVIDLRSNFLKDIYFDMTSLVDLEILNLKNNEINFLCDQSIKKLDRVFKNNGNAKIDLSNNPLQCNFFTLQFLNWMRHGHKHFTNFIHYRCTYENGSFSMPNSFEDVILHLQTVEIILT